MIGCNEQCAGDLESEAGCVGLHLGCCRMCEPDDHCGCCESFRSEGAA